METKLDFDDVLITPRASSLKSRADVNLRRTFYFPRRNRSLTTIPIIAANMENIGTVKVARILDQHYLMTALVKGTKVSSEIPWYTFKTYGIDENMGLGNCFFICLDVANGYTDKFVEWVKRVRDYRPNAIIMAGNVATREGVYRLSLAGADIIKVGLGSGSACTTRVKTGVGIPQLSAIMDCADSVAEYNDVFICSDGGHKTPGDIAKAYAAGADFVMLGGMFAGTDETGLELHGNASLVVQKDFEKYRTDEGVTVRHRLKGSLDDVVHDILGGLRSACTYVGARNLEELQEKAVFVRRG